MAGTADCGVASRTAATIGQGFAGGIASVHLCGLRCHPECFFLPSFHYCQDGPYIAKMDPAVRYSNQCARTSGMHFLHNLRLGRRFMLVSYASFAFNMLKFELCASQPFD